MCVPKTLIWSSSLLNSQTLNGNITTAHRNEEEHFYGNAARRVVRKLDQRLLLFLCILEISSFLNRVSIGMYN